MDFILDEIEINGYKKCGLEVSAFQFEDESKEYHACRFKLNGIHIIGRTAKITPKKVGQFVTFWKRNLSGVIEPFEQSDFFDFFIVNVSKNELLGQFVFPKSVLMKKGIVSTKDKEGKRGFRVYPSWDNAKSKQAKSTQRWQLKYFYVIDEEIDLKRLTHLYSQV